MSKLFKIGDDLYSQLEIARFWCTLYMMSQNKIYDINDNDDDHLPRNWKK